MAVVRDRARMIAGMAPSLDAETYVFCSCDAAFGAAYRDAALGSFREAEGVTLILAERDARRAGFPVDAPMRRITLQVPSALDGVGLTAAVAGALAEADVPCNMVAAYHHDHVFVPAADADRALDILKRRAEREA